MINGQDAYATYGVVMGSGFINTIEGGIPLKEGFENTSRRQHGVQKLVNPYYDKRSLNLQFNIHGRTKSEFLTRKHNFELLLLSGIVDIQIVDASAPRTEVYHLVYTGKNVTYNHSYNGKFGTWLASFEEPNPYNRTAQRDNNVRVIS